MATQHLEIGGSLKRTVKGNHNFYYGGGEEAWSSLASAIAGVPMGVRIGQTVGVYNSGKIDEYWWNEGIADDQLVLKLVSGDGTAIIPNLQQVTNGSGNNVTSNDIVIQNDIARAKLAISDYGVGSLDLTSTSGYGMNLVYNQFNFNDIGITGELLIPSIAGAYSWTFPAGTGFLPLTVSLNGGSPVIADSHGNINLPITTSESYTLPVATSTILGGVKVSGTKGIYIDTDGEISTTLGLLTPRSIPYIGSAGMLVEDNAGLSYDGNNVSAGHSNFNAYSGLQLNGGRAGMFGWGFGMLLRLGSGNSAKQDLSKSFTFSNLGHEYLKIYTTGVTDTDHPTGDQSTFVDYARFNANVFPNVDLQFSLGTDTKRWLNTYSQNVYTDNLYIGGTLFTGGSTTIPTLQQVTTAGFSTTNNIFASVLRATGDGLSTKGYYVEMGVANLYGSNAGLISFKSTTNFGVQLLPAIGMTVDKQVYLPNAAGTVAMSVNGVAADTTGNIILPTLTSSNGITKVSNDFQLGGTLTKNTTIDAGNNDFNITSTSSNVGVKISNSNGIGLYVNSGGIAVSANNAPSAQFFGGFADPNNGHAVIIQASSGGPILNGVTLDLVSGIVPVSFYASSSSNNTVIPIMKLGRGSTNEAIGCGVSLAFQLGLQNGISDAGYISTAWTSVTSIPSRTVRMDFAVNNGNTSNIRMSIMSNGDIIFQNLRTFATEAAAVTAGLTSGTVYKTSTGELRIKL